MTISFSRIFVGIAFVIGVTSSYGASPDTCALDNLGEHKSKLTAYKSSGQYDADLAAIAAEVKQYLQEWLGKVDKPAIVLDIDETALSNYSALELYRFARENNVAIFFITGRPERTREATERNLRDVGYDGWEKAVLKPADLKVASAADYKGPVRCEVIAQGYNIVVNIGDRPSDLAGGCAEKTFLLPNPFYWIP